MSSPTSLLEPEDLVNFAKVRRKMETAIPTWIHDVFLSFRGEDTRASFTSHLHASLQNAGINVFLDDLSLERGDLISSSLPQAIEDSQISVVVFSRNYPDSRWCLEELVKIMKCRRTRGQVVLPVFYDVDPSEVHNQTGEFGKPFQNLLNRIPEDEEDWYLLRQHLERRWRKALREAAGLAGFVVSNSSNGSEAIKAIVENVTRLLDKTDLFIANNLMGVETRVRDMIQLLDLDIQQTNDVLLLGMWGMGGVGKTTIAKAVYNKIGRNFEGRSFLANIREVWEQSGERVSLQEQLLFDIYKTTTTKIGSIESGKTILKDRLCHKRVLLVLDDVNTLDQLNALCGSRQWFGSGSKIIITTRDMNILRGDRVDHVYKMKEMDESESIELFSWHAFKQTSPREDFAGISRNVVEYSGGLPLALEVLGSYLFDRAVTEWECVLEKLKRIPNDEVQKKLKISYDGLNDDTEKEIFLDIACFFIGMDRNDAIHILNGCALYAEIGISVLVERSLVTVDDRNRLGMHDLVRDMGREIIREKSPKKPQKRSRLWFREDVLDVLTEKTGTKAVEGVALKLPRTNAKCFSTKAFKKMKRLRLLQLAGVQLDGDFEHLSRNLRWLSWNGFPLTCIPTNFYQGNLVSVELENSNLKLVWRETQRMEMLKILNLSHSHYLTQTPDFSFLPNLEKLVLKDCPRLSEVSRSIGHLNKVLLINLEDCIGLRSLPRSIYKLKSLKTLIISGCLKIDKLEEDLEHMESLTTLIANNTAITRVPFSVVKLKSIGYISLCGYEGFSRDVFPSIIHSWMSPAWIHDVFLSFRWQDTRASFTSHLHASLQNDGINVFIDDRSLERGDLISDSLLQAIEKSQISIVVFSINYADSRWCLQELVKIMECHRTIGQVVLPVFYGVDPSEVRHQTGEFGKAFQNLLDIISKKEHNWLLVPEEEDESPLREHLELRWREALCQAAGLAGFVVVNSRNESEATKDIVENVTRLLDKTDLFIASNPVGVETRVGDMIQQLDLDIQRTNDVLLLGMWGMGGVGKTTIAKAVYNKIGRNFEGRSFLANIREVWEQSGERVSLQEQLLFDICKTTTTKIHSIESGKTILKDRLCHKRVLLVLDDVNTLDQLNALCGSRQWFASGSRIIITTRDMNILRGDRVDHVYKMKEMDESESIELFSRHAFKQTSPREDFAGISRNVVEYSGGLPLAYVA